MNFQLAVLMILLRLILFIDFLYFCLIFILVGAGFPRRQLKDSSYIVMIFVKLFSKSQRL